MSKWSVYSLAALLLLAGCDLKIKEKETAEGNKNVEISSSLGQLKVRTDEVDPGDTGLTVYPGSRLKPKDNRDNENKANVDINTPWFGVKVVALTYESDDSPEKVWSYYRDEMAKKWGKPLECRPGSPDLNRKKQGKDDLVCENEGGRKIHIDADTHDMQLKVGSEDRQHIVAVKQRGGKTQYSLVYVTVRGERETL